MKHEILTTFFPEGIDLYILLFLGFILSFLITVIITPKLILLVKNKRIGDVPNERSSHRTITPTLGGIAFYICLIVGMISFSLVDSMSAIYYFIPALTVLFIAGLFDDIIGLSAKTKLFTQFLAITIIMMSIDIDNISLHGFMGIVQIPSFLKIVLVFLSFIIITNAMNLIDGIDGLAALMGIIILGIFAFLFFKVGSAFNVLLSLSLIGSLAAFLIFNLSKKRKIFMGDTGSMIIGFVIAYLTINFISLTDTELSSLGVYPKNAVYSLIGILFIPLLDVCRVFVLRLYLGISPFTADRKHLHHVLIDSGLTHIKSSLILSFFSILNFGIIYFLSISRDVNIFIVILLISVASLQMINFLKKNPGLFNDRSSFIKVSHRQIGIFIKSLKDGAAVVFRSLF